MASDVAATLATPTAAPPLDLRPLCQPADLRQCQALQRRAWGITEDGYVVPVATMAGAALVGGLVLGAFDPSTGALVGFSFAFLGRLDGRLILYSQLTAVDPDRQGTGVGRALKFEQRRRAADQGLDRVAWAFDPLQASNAAFNLGVLGACARRYEVDLYGTRSDALNAGLATDRLLAEWPTAGLEPPAPPDPAAWRDAPDLVLLHAGAPDASPADRPLDHPRLRLAVPPSLAAVKRADPDLARRWQRQVRHAFGRAFAAGYAAVGFARGDQPAYLLAREERP